MTDLEEKVLASIERQKLQPKPAYVFMARRSVFWLLAILSIILGGITFAVLLYGLTGFLKDGWRSFDEVPLEEILFSIPVAWMLIMPLFVASAYFGFRHTRRGYRMKPSVTIAGSLAASLLLGASLQWFNVGNHINEFLERKFAFYERMTHIPYGEWSRPDAGFLGGHADKMLNENTLLLTDFRGKTWTVDLSGATVALDNAIVDEGDVAIHGVKTGSSTFKAETLQEFD
jgi:hypothetical protein